MVFLHPQHDLLQFTQLLLVRKGGSHSDQPSCEQMTLSSPFCTYAR